MREISKFWISVIVITIAGLYSLPASASGENEELNKIKVMWDQRVPMRDGVELSADIFLPKGGGRYPTLLMRNPYTKSTRRAGIPYDFISYFAERGYALVGQDVRGRGDSDGEFGYSRMISETLNCRCFISLAGSMVINQVRCTIGAACNSTLQQGISNIS